MEYLTGAWAQNYEKIWIIQGPVFYPDETPVAWVGDEGERKIAVPDAVFKIVVRDNPKKVLAFLYPQLAPEYFLSCSDERNYRHSRFLTTVDEIEKLTGLDFKLPDNLEHQRATALWEPQVVNLKNRELFLSGCGN